MDKTYASLVCLLFAIVFTLAGCGQSSSGDVSADDLSKAEAIAVTDKDGTVLETITDKAAIETFITALCIDEWSLSELPEDAVRVGSFGLSQNETIHPGETASDVGRFDVGTITVYEGPYLSVSLLGLDFVFAIPDDAHQALMDYFA